MRQLAKATVAVVALVVAKSLGAHVQTNLLGDYPQLKRRKSSGSENGESKLRVYSTIALRLF